MEGLIRLNCYLKSGNRAGTEAKPKETAMNVVIQKFFKPHVRANLSVAGKIWMVLGGLFLAQTVSVFVVFSL